MEYVTSETTNISGNEDNRVTATYLIYYAPSFRYYDTDIEDKDLEFFKKFGKLINPNGLNLGNSMMKYIKKIYESNMVCYRGYTEDVTFEVLSALVFGKTVYSMNKRIFIHTYEQAEELVNIFKKKRTF